MASKSKLKYEVQYSASKDTLWIHCSSGETVGRFSSKFGMDIHNTIAEQAKGSSQCLHCTHTKPTPEDFDLFCKKAKELWNVKIDKSQINFTQTTTLPLLRTQIKN